MIKKFSLGRQDVGSFITQIRQQFIKLHQEPKQVQNLINRYTNVFGNGRAPISYGLKNFSNMKFSFKLQHTSISRDLIFFRVRIVAMLTVTFKFLRLFKTSRVAVMYSFRFTTSFSKWFISIFYFVSSFLVWILPRPRAKRRKMLT